MSKALKAVCLLIFAALVLWGGGILLHLGSREDDDGIFRVVLDPGHGGEDPGAVVGEVQEKDINLAIALQVRELLAEQEEIEVLMTREQDVYPTLTDRADFANENQADLYISIHVNSLEDESFAGIMTFFHPEKRSSRAYAQAIQDALTTASGGLDRGVRSEDYAVLRETDMPAVLVETGFMTCPEELALLLDKDYQQHLAQGIAQGILDCRHS